MWWRYLYVNLGVNLDVDVDVEKYKELIYKCGCGKRFIWNHRNCEYERHKSCDVGEYLDHEHCKCRKRLIDKLVEECSENIDENDLIYNSTLNDHKNVSGSSTVYIVLFATFLIISKSLTSVFIYFYWYLKRSNTNVVININPSTKTVIY